LARRAKYILAPLDRDETLVIHLGMTGRFTIEGAAGRKRPGDFALAASADPKHAHVQFETDAGAVVTYFDPRRFGYMGLVQTGGLADHPWFAGLGPEPLSDAFSSAGLKSAFTGRRQNVKALLLDQRIVAGLGNIYVCEALHRARIHPEVSAGLLSAGRLKRLVEAIKQVLAEAIEAGGSTLRDFANAEGELGYFQHRFCVYGREDEPCLRKSCQGVVARIVQAGRSTFYCPVCQR
jgi:formamidopyrimidine-DNA glycosylase